MDNGLAFLGSCFVLMSTCASVYAIREFRNGRRSPNWPCVKGTVVESSVQIDDDCTPFPSIRYKYYIDSVPFHCDRILYEGRRCDTKTAEAFVAKYPTGKKVNVHYDPTDAETAVLEPGVAVRTGFIALLVLLGFHLAGWCMLCFAIT